MSFEQTALLVIDLQNDYFGGGAFPLWKSEEVKNRIVDVMSQATQSGIQIIHIQHLANPEKLAPFFNEGTLGAEIHRDILSAAPDAPVIVKRFADAFENTELEAELASHQIKNLLLCGMMTQNCVTHTAISKAVEKYSVTLLSDSCTTVSEMIHLIALNALTNRPIKISSSSEVFNQLS